MQPHPTLTDHYRNPEEQRTYLNRLFDAGAPFYDKIDRWCSLGTGPKYRRDAQARAGLKPGMKLLDVATGTGLMAEGAMKLGVPAADITCVDPSEGMLTITRGKMPGITTLVGTATALPVETEKYDFLTMGFALRHVADLEGAFREYHRALKPGGKLLVLELTKPKGGLAAGWFKFWFRDVYPALSYLITRNRNARDMMRYYWETMDVVVPPETILDAMCAAGFTRVKRRAIGGICSEYAALKR